MAITALLVRYAAVGSLSVTRACLDGLQAQQQAACAAPQAVHHLAVLLYHPRISSHKPLSASAQQHWRKQVQGRARTICMLWADCSSGNNMVQERARAICMLQADSSFGNKQMQAAQSGHVAAGRSQIVQQFGGGRQVSTTHY